MIEKKSALTHSYNIYFSLYINRLSHYIFIEDYEVKLYDL